MELHANSSEQVHFIHRVYDSAVLLLSAVWRTDVGYICEVGLGLTLDELSCIESKSGPVAISIHV